MADIVNGPVQLQDTLDSAVDSAYRELAGLWSGSNASLQERFNSKLD